MEKPSTPVDSSATGLVNAELKPGAKVGGDRYCLTRMLGRGGMGIVWLARDERLHIDVALKFLSPQIRDDATALDDLRYETTRSRKLTHPNIIRIHDLYEAPDEDAFISMEYVDGCNLADLRVRQATRVFSWDYLKPLVEQLCAALTYAHGERLIHRDLKPTNLIVDGKGHLKLADFGIARSVSDTMSRNPIGQTSSTFLYMSPQQMEGGRVHVTDDIYALGATLYELLTSKPPFYTGNVTHQICSVAPQPMQARLKEAGLQNNIPKEVEQVIMACLSKEPSHRPQTAAALGRLLNGQKPRLRLESLNPSERRPLWWTLVAAIAIGITVWTVAEKGRKARQVRQNLAAGTVPAGVTPRAGAAESGPSTMPAVTNEKPAAVALVPRPASALPLATGVPPATVASAEPSQPSARITEAAPTNSPPPVVVHKPEVAAARPAAPATVAPIIISRTNLSASVARDKATALRLLEKGNSHVSERSRDRVLQITSGHAPIDEAPREWQILYYDEKATYNAVEVRFENGEMVRVHEPNRFFSWFKPGAQKTLDLARVKTDSNQAIRIATAECTGDGVTPKSVEMKLERGYGGSPVWNVKVFGVVAGKSPEEVALGSVIVLAEDGKVLKKEMAGGRTNRAASPKQGRP